MAIGVRDITNLEELLEVQDDDKIIVIQNGEAKLISKANAKFGGGSGGGSVTIFYADADELVDIQRLVDADGNPISAQAAYDAVMSGPVYIYKITPEDNVTIHVLMAPSMVEIMKTGEKIDTTILDTERYSFYAGRNPIH